MKSNAVQAVWWFCAGSVSVPTTNSCHSSATTATGFAHRPSVKFPKLLGNSSFQSLYKKIPATNVYTKL